MPRGVSAPRAAKKRKSPTKSATPKKAAKTTVRDDNKAQSRAALVAAAATLFSEQGLDLPSLDAICERAGYTRGAFYVHFRDREELLVAVMDAIGESFLSSVFRAAPVTPLAGQRLRSVVARFVDAVQDGRYPLMSTGGKSPTIKPHQLLDACARSAVVRDRYRQLVETSIEGVKALVELDQIEGGIRKDLDPALAAKLALCTIVGAQTLGEVGVELGAIHLATFVEALFSEPSSGASR